MLLRSVRSVALACALAASAVPFVACSASPTAVEPSSAAQSNETTAALGVTVHGRAKVVADALAQVPLRADQRAAIEQMAKDYDARRAPVRAARADLANAIADQVQSGTIDRAALQPKLDALAGARAAVRPQDRAAFEKLHDLLTADQRTAFVAAIQGRHGHGQGHGMRARMHKWATELGLTQEQQDQIRDKMRARWQAHLAAAAIGTDAQKTGAVEDGQRVARGHAMHARWQATLEAFKSDKFSLDAVAPANDHAAHADRFAGRALGMLETALPVLTPAQRTAAAEKLRARATHLDEEQPGVEAPAAR